MDDENQRYIGKIDAQLNTLKEMLRKYKLTVDVMLVTSTEKA